MRVRESSRSLPGDHDRDIHLGILSKFGDNLLLGEDSCLNNNVKRSENQLTLPKAANGHVHNLESATDHKESISQ